MFRLQASSNRTWMVGNGGHEQRDDCDDHVDGSLDECVDVHADGTQDDQVNRIHREAGATITLMRLEARKWMKWMIM